MTAAPQRHERRPLLSLVNSWPRVAVLCALALLGTPWRTSAGQAKPLSAILMVASAQVTDPFFSDSVVLVMNDLGSGPIGIIINRPTQVPISRLFPKLQRLSQLQDKVYFGGPVDFGSVW